MYVNKETDHDVWKFMMYLDDGCGYIMYEINGFIHDISTSIINGVHPVPMYLITRCIKKSIHDGHGYIMYKSIGFKKHENAKQKEQTYQH